MDEMFKGPKLKIQKGGNIQNQPLKGNGKGTRHTFDQQNKGQTNAFLKTKICLRNI